MPLASDMMKGGMSAGMAAAANGQIISAATAAGTAITDAYDIISSNVVVTAGSGGVQLPAAMIGDDVFILNLLSTPITVYPDSTSGRINQLAAGNGFVLPSNTAVMCKKFTSTRWIGFLSA